MPIFDTVADAARQTGPHSLQHGDPALQAVGAGRRPLAAERRGEWDNLGLQQGLGIGLAGARMAQRDLPIWMHPARPATFADYAGEPRSKYDMWWAFGWPYETSVAMGRLVFSGIFCRL